MLIPTRSKSKALAEASPYAVSSAHRRFAGTQH